MTAVTDPLFQPLAVRSMDLRNRVVMSAMTRYFSPGGIPGVDVARYYARRAAGGAGLIVTEGVGIDDSASVDHTSIPVMHGAKAGVVASYARAAKDAVAMGFDGIAIHGAHGYLIDTFFWADTNRRTDRYGGSPENRARFGAEVVRGIRAEIGDDLPILFRFSQHKQQDYDACFASTPEELGLMLNILADAGVDLFDASSRRFNRPIFAGSALTLAGWARRLTGAGDFGSRQSPRGPSVDGARHVRFGRGRARHDQRSRMDKQGARGRAVPSLRQERPIAT